MKAGLKGRIFKNYLLNIFYMLDPGFKVSKQENATFAPLPESIYQAELLDITTIVSDNKFKRNEKDPATRTTFKFQFTVLDPEHRGRNIWDSWIPTTLFISKKKGKNALYQVLEAFLGHDLSPIEENSIDSNFLNNLVGRQIRLFVVPDPKKPTEYNIINRYMKATIGLPPLTDEEKERARVKIAEAAAKKEKASDTKEMSPEDLAAFEAAFGATK